MHNFFSIKFQIFLKLTPTEKRIIQKNVIINLHDYNLLSNIITFVLHYYHTTLYANKMEIFLLIASIILYIIGLAGCILPALAGQPFCYLALLLAYWSGYVPVSITTLIVWGIVTLLLTILEIFLTPWMTRRFGGSKGGEWGAIVGLAIGMFLPWPWGPMAGPFLGAFVGEWVVSRQSSDRALKAALGSFLSFFVGIGIKLLACVGMLMSALMAIA